MAFFFALDMGGGELLLSSPALPPPPAPPSSGAGPAPTRSSPAPPPASTAVATSWKQAVQRLPALRRHETLSNEPLRVLAKHDTYGVTFGWAPAPASGDGEAAAAAAAPAEGARAGRDVAFDAAVRAADEELAAPLARSVAQDPLAYRRLACAAVRLALAQDEGASAVGAAVARLLS